MSTDINTITITGRLGNPPELKFTQSGFAILTFSVAVGSRQKSGNDYKDHTDWIDCKVIGKRAEGLSKILDKSTFVAVQGRLQQERWETKEGQKRSKHVVIVEELALSGKPRSDGGSQPRGGARDDGAQEQEYGGGGDDSDIPF